MTRPRRKLLWSVVWWYYVLHLCNVGPREAAGQSHSNADCQDDQEEHLGKCYLRVDSRKTFDDAQNYCRDRGGIIAMVTNRNEDDVMVDIMRSEGWRRMWIGVREVNTPWRWVKDNSYISYQGCYADLAGGLLPNWRREDNNLTPQTCIEECAAQDYRYAGIKFSSDRGSGDIVCSCAKGFSTEGIVQQGCDIPCRKEGFTNISCGGVGFIQVYRTDGLAFNGWSADQPNNKSDYQSCMSLNKDAFKWGDEKCHGEKARNTIYSHICEYDMPEFDCEQNGYTNDQTSGKCISLHRDSQLSWYEARAKCLNQGGDLVKIDSAEAQAFLSREGSNGDRWWVGASNRKYEWGNGAEMVFSKFAHDQPEADRQDCVISFAGASDSYKWQSKSCDEEYEFVCEIDSPLTTASSATTTTTPPSATTTTPSTTTPSTTTTTTPSTTTTTTPSTTTTTTPSTTTTTTPSTTTTTTTTNPVTSTNANTSTATTTTTATQKVDIDSGSNGPISTTIQDGNQKLQLGDDDDDDDSNVQKGVLIGIGVAAAVVFF